MSVIVYALWTLCPHNLPTDCAAGPSPVLSPLLILHCHAYLGVIVAPSCEDVERYVVDRTLAAGAGAAVAVILKTVLTVGER